MSDKTFLQSLDIIKRKAENCYNEYPTGDDTAEQLQEIIRDISDMINQCIEIQLAMMKQGQAK